MAQHILETDGLICPFPVQEAKAAMRDLSVGDELVIHFDCTQELKPSPVGRPKIVTPPRISSNAGRPNGASPSSSPRDPREPHQPTCLLEV